MTRPSSSLSPCTVLSSTPFVISTFRLPDLASCCDRLAHNYHRNGDAIAAVSAKWYENECNNFTEERRRRVHGLKAGQLVAYGYSHGDDELLRILCDCMNFLFLLDDSSDGMMTTDTEVLADVVLNALWFPQFYRPTHARGKEQPEDESDASKLARNVWSRCIKDAGPGVQARFCESMELYLNAVGKEAKYRDNGIPPDLKSYMEVRRDTSGVKPCFDLLEYALRIELPNVVFDDPIIKTMRHTAIDFIAWANDVFSYNVEQSRGDIHNIVMILMKSHGLDVQKAVDCAGDMCREAIDIFCENKEKIPSWGPDVDKDVAGYIRGLEELMTGSVHWSFVSERYFGGKAAEVKQTHIVELLPKLVQTDAT